ncbi:MAG: biopolymer transporter ExbD [bacterium]|nr:MAG: biopolymer transporter ExbD [bacterium]
MSKRAAPEINAGSIADIAFLLLIFFLVTTTMNVDTGITRILPPPVKNKSEKLDVKERNVLKVLINNHNFMLVNGKPANVHNLVDKIIDFMTVHPNNKLYPEVKEEYIPELGKKVMMTKGIVSLKNDRGTSYNMYIRVQDAIAKAFNEMKNQAAIKYYGVKFDQLINSKKIKVINKLVPIRVSEAEPENVGGGK